MRTGVILAGGQNRRMNGRCKALLPFKGKTILERQISEMERFCEEIILVTNQPEQFKSYVSAKLQVIVDRIPGKGPLSGMHAAFHHAMGEECWVVGCDLPFASEKVAQFLLELRRESGADAVVPVVHGRIHPLHAVYHRRSLAVLSDCLLRGEYRVQHFLRQIHTLEVKEREFLDRGFPSTFVFNVNTPEEYQRAKNLKI
jgi:molybdopterin-guanine dinucleotide biosynthesis protein A